MIVSPSAILITMPSRILAAEWEGETERRSRNARAMVKRDRGLSIGNAPQGDRDIMGQEKYRGIIFCMHQSISIQFKHRGRK